MCGQMAADPGKVVAQKTCAPAREGIRSEWPEASWFRFLLHAVAGGSRFLRSYFHLLPVCLRQPRVIDGSGTSLSNPNGCSPETFMLSPTSLATPPHR